MIVGDIDGVVMSLVNIVVGVGGSSLCESSTSGAISCNRSHGHGLAGEVVVDWILVAYAIFDIVHGGEASFEVLEIRVR